MEIKSGQPISRDAFKGLDYFNRLSGASDSSHLLWHAEGNLPYSADSSKQFVVFGLPKMGDTSTKALATCVFSAGYELYIIATDHFLKLNIGMANEAIFGLLASAL